MSVLVDWDEPSRGVELPCWIVLGDAKTDGPISLRNTGLDKVDEVPSSDPLVPTRGDYRNREFGHIVGDESIATIRLGIRPIPSRADRPGLFSNQSVVARPWPSSQIHRVPRIGHHLVGGR